MERLEGRSSETVECGWRKWEQEWSLKMFVFHVHVQGRASTWELSPNKKSFRVDKASSQCQPSADIRDSSVWMGTWTEWPHVGGDGGFAGAQAHKRPFTKAGIISTTVSYPGSQPTLTLRAPNTVLVLQDTNQTPDSLLSAALSILQEAVIDF